MTIRIVVADDHPIVLDGLAQLFSVEGEFGGGAAPGSRKRLRRRTSEMITWGRLHARG